jgi:heme exporter protein C
MWWKILLFFWIAALSAVGIMTPVAGDLNDLRIIGQMSAEKQIPVKFTSMNRAAAHASEDGLGFVVPAVDGKGNAAEFQFPSRPRDFDTAEGYLAMARYDAATHRILVGKVLGGYASFSFPYIPALEERAKIIFFHVPMSWMTVIAFMVSMWYGILYLRKKNLDDDLKSAVSAGLGLLFCILATTTGSVWAKFNWGSFWNWDPRETSIFVLLLVYGAYFALRSAIEVDEKKATLSAVYSILAAVTVPFFIFIMPRIMPGLHPGSSDDVNSGPVVSKGGMNGAMRVVMYGILAGYLVLYVWLMRLKIAVQRIALRNSTAA